MYRFEFKFSSRSKSETFNAILYHYGMNKCAAVLFNFTSFPFSNEGFSFLREAEPIQMWDSHSWGTNSNWDRGVFQMNLSSPPRKNNQSLRGLIRPQTVYKHDIGEVVSSVWGLSWLAMYKDSLNTETNSQFSFNENESEIIRTSLKRQNYTYGIDKIEISDSVVKYQNTDFP